MPLLLAGMLLVLIDRSRTRSSVRLSGFLNRVKSNTLFFSASCYVSVPRVTEYDTLVLIS